MLVDCAVAEFDAACEAVENSRLIIVDKGREIADARRRRVVGLADHLLSTLDESPDLPQDVQRTVEALAIELDIDPERR